jgi:hypothetical protein
VNAKCRLSNWAPAEWRYRQASCSLCLIAACEACVPSTAPSAEQPGSITIGSPGEVGNQGRIIAVGCVFTPSQQLQLELKSTCNTEGSLKVKVEDARPSHYVLYADTVDGLALTSTPCCTCIGPLGSAPEGGVAQVDVHVDGLCPQSDTAATSPRFTCEVRGRGRIEPSCCEGRRSCEVSGRGRDGG